LERVADPSEAGEGGKQKNGLDDFEIFIPAAETRIPRLNDRHDPKGGQVVGQFESDDRRPGRVGRQGGVPIGGGFEITAELDFGQAHPSSRFGSSAAGIVALFAEMPLTDDMDAGFRGLYR
jgi:hypothetical protein